MLTRLYDRYFAAAPAKIGFVSDVAKNISWTGFTDLILSGGRLSASGVMTAPKGTDDFLVQCRLQGSRVLGVTVTPPPSAATPRCRPPSPLGGGWLRAWLSSVSGMTAKQREASRLSPPPCGPPPGEDRLPADCGRRRRLLTSRPGRPVRRAAAGHHPGPRDENGIRVAPLEPPEEIVRSLAAVPAAARGKLILTLSTTAGGRTEAESRPWPKIRPYYFRPLRPELPPPQLWQRRLLPRRGLHPGEGPALPPLRHRHPWPSAISPPSVRAAGS